MTRLDRECCCQGKELVDPTKIIQTSRGHYRLIPPSKDLPDSQVHDHYDDRIRCNYDVHDHAGHQQCGQRLPPACCLQIEF